jgi:hypothetical protein
MCVYICIHSDIYLHTHTYLLTAVEILKSVIKAHKKRKTKGMTDMGFRTFCLGWEEGGKRKET